VGPSREPVARRKPVALRASRCAGGSPGGVAREGWRSGKKGVRIGAAGVAAEGGPVIRAEAGWRGRRFGPNGNGLQDGPKPNRVC